MKTDNSSREIKIGLRKFGNFLKTRFNLDDDRATQSEVVENIARGVEFRGTNLWVLIFATFIASLGLNVNSTAVIIGAMLISPLMGPIMGLGLSLGVNDFELFKRSFRNFIFMVTVSIITSTVYFIVSPLSNAQSELLARTTPSIYDVLIAFFGGLAGIVAQSRKDRTSIVIPGVAIATALMPPLCTAGFGIATGQWTFFIGAFYLFSINAVFIAIATFMIVRFLKYDKKVLLDRQRARKVHNYMVVIIVLTLTPSTILTYNIVQRSIFENNADRYVESVFNFSKTQVIEHTRKYRERGGNSQIDLLLIGETLSQDVIENARFQMAAYGLKDTELIVRQADGSEPIDINTLQTGYIQLLDEKNKQIAELNQRLSGYMDVSTLADIAREAGTVVENIKKISLSRQIEYDTGGRSMDTVLVCVVSPSSVRMEIDRDRLSRWLAARTKNGNVKIYVE